MCNHHEEKQVKPLYQKNHSLKGGQVLEVRSFNFGDEEGLIEFMKQVDGETNFLARAAGEFNFTVQQERAFIEGTLKNKNAQFLLAAIDGEIAGTVSVGRVMAYRRYVHRGTMGIVVRQKYWRKGIGRVMMQEAIDWCRNNGIEQLELEVLSENERARAMYESFGFQIQGTKHRAHKYDDGSYGDEYLMVLYLDK